MEKHLGFAFVITACVATTAHAQGQHAFAARNEGGAELLDVVTNHEGDVLSVIGLFDIGLADPFGPDEEIVDAFGTFLLDETQSFGLREGFSKSLLRIVERTDYADFVIILFEAYTPDGLRVLESQTTAVIRHDGKLHAVHGKVRAGLSAATTNEMSAAAAAALLSEFGVSSELTTVAPNLFADADGTILLERAVERRNGEVMWVLETADSIVQLTERTGDIARRSRILEIEDTSCVVVATDYPRDGNGRVTAFGGAGNSGTQSLNNLTCSGTQWPPPIGCYWQLRFEQFGTPHHLGRVLDFDDAEVEVYDQQCTSAGTFTATTGDAFEQQLNYFYALRMREFVKQNVWDDVPHDAEGHVVITVDHTDTSQFTPSTQDIKISFGSTLRCGSIMHEYGHYVNWTYNGFSALCDEGDDEGIALEESVANAFALMVMRDDEEAINVRYDTDITVSQWPGPHKSSGDKETFGTCNGDPHLMGIAFEQAIWELLFNEDCTTGLTQCNFTQTNGNEIWVGYSDEQVVATVGKALAHASKTHGDNVTFSEFVSTMRSLWVLDDGTAAANRARAVFTHHGI